MRQLKFRAWDIKEKVMHKAGFLIDSDGTIFDNTLCDGEIESFSFGSGQIILVQYTGLKDKNGKEIYEGDILEYDVLYNQKRRFVINSIEDLYFNDMLDYVFSNGLIIGNIYNNPELMGAKQ